MTSQVLVQVVPPTEGREIGSGSSAAAQLASRLEDIKRAIAGAADAVASGLTEVKAADGWSLDEVSTSFGVSLTTEAGLILAKASGGATFEVTLTFKREPSP